MYREDDFLRVINDAYQAYLQFGNRSNKKNKILSDYFSKVIKDVFGSEYSAEIQASINGQYFDKETNIKISKGSSPVLCVNITFNVTSYLKNINNHLENLMGQVVNIQSFEKTPYLQILILRYEAPVISKGKITKYEILSEKDLLKYINITCGIKHVHSPYATCIFLVDIDKKSDRVTFLDTNNLYDENTNFFLKNKLSINHFLDTIDDYKKFYTLSELV
jgi:hypothetical protein